MPIDVQARDSIGSTALHMAAEHGHTKLIQYFSEQVRPFHSTHVARCPGGTQHCSVAVSLGVVCAQL